MSAERRKSDHPTLGPRTTSLVAASLCSILIGGLIYLAWRDENLRMFTWMTDVGLGPAIESLRLGAAGWREHVPQWAMYSLPDACWVFSATTSLHCVWAGCRSPAALLWTSVPLTLGLGGELGQLARVVPGTFNPIDLVMMVGAAILAFALAEGVTVGSSSPWRSIVSNREEPYKTS